MLNVAPSAANAECFGGERSSNRGWGVYKKLMKPLQVGFGKKLGTRLPPTD